MKVPFQALVKLCSHYHNINTDKTMPLFISGIVFKAAKCHVAYCSYSYSIYFSAFPPAIGVRAFGAARNPGAHCSLALPASGGVDQVPITGLGWREAILISSN